MLFKCYNSILTRLPPCMLQYYALQILETVIKTRWKILPRNQCEGKTLFMPQFFCSICVNAFLFFLFLKCDVWLPC